jgi:hypothetical protein
MKQMGACGVVQAPVLRARFQKGETQVLTIRFTRAAAVAAALTLPTALQAQSRVQARTSSPVAVSEASARAWYTELQQIQARLQMAHNRVMQDPQMRGQQEAFMRDVKAAMLRVDPGLDALAARVETMQSQAVTAQRRGDRAQLRQLNFDLVSIQQRFMRAQQAVMQQPALSSRARQLEQQLHIRMLQVEPETDRLISRGKDLQQRLIGMQQQMVARPQVQPANRPN